MHDRELLDALEALDSLPMAGPVWRTIRRGRDPLRGSTANGRWGAAGEIEVLYTSLERNGALAEVGYRLGLEPIWPSKLEHEVSQISIELEKVCDLTDFSFLSSLGLDEGRYEGHDYAVEQAISAAAKFLGFEGILVPNARYRCNNLVIFTDVIDCGNLTVEITELVDWNAWRASNKMRPSRTK